MTIKTVDQNRYNYRGVIIHRNDHVPAGKKGRFRIKGELFSQLTHAKSWVDSQAQRKG